MVLNKMSQFKLKSVDKQKMNPPTFFKLKVRSEEGRVRS
jgi:hypothetical protein